MTRFWSATREPPCGSVAFDISLVTYNEENGESLFYLHELGGKREISFKTGVLEWREADRLLRRITFPRPLIHDLAINIIEKLHGQLPYVAITRIDITGCVYYALLLVQRGSDVIAIDARPSDAIVMALHTGALVLVSEDVLSILFPA